MHNTEQLVQWLSRVSHFKKLPPSALYEVVTSGEIKRYSKGQVIYVEGEPCSGLFVLFRGRVHLCKTSHQGQESIIAVIDPVIMFNEVPVLDGGHNAVTAVAEQNCILWRITRNNFQVLAQRYPEIALSLLPVLAKRNRMLLSFCEDVAFRSVMGRTAKILLGISHQGQIQIDRRMHTNQVLAAQAATVPEPFCRAVRVLRQGGTIKCTRTAITILDPVKLAHIAEVDSAGTD
jgi:CRP/FNR family transcriptional regulator, dissimilatory nitrate respiration regulator